MISRNRSGRRRSAALAFIVITVLVLNYAGLLSLPFSFEEPPQPDRPNFDLAPPCAPTLDHLRRSSYGLTRDIIYQKRCIRPVIDKKLDSQVVSQNPDALIKSGQIVQLDQACEGWTESTCEPVALRVPPPYPQQDYSGFLFGVATNLDRLNESMSQFESWLGNTHAQLLAIITDPGDESKYKQVTEEFRQRGIELSIKDPWNKAITSNEQHFAIVRDLLAHVTPKTQWTAIVDDDTFFPSLYPMSKILAKYDHKLPAYVGGLSENYDAVKHHGYMAFGGAGIFLSPSLLRELDPHLEECLKVDHVPQGDGLLKQCIYSKTKTKLTVVKGLHQLDMGGDMSGFYESGRLPMTLHHWKSWHQAPVDKMVKISEFCGSCFLQRFAFGSDTVLTNGYSIVQYSAGLESVDLNKMEGSWEGAEGFDWSLSPMRSKMDRRLKKSYHLVDTEMVGKNIRQIYIHRLENDIPGPDEKSKDPKKTPPKIEEMKDEAKRWMRHRRQHLQAAKVDTVPPEKVPVIEPLHDFDWKTAPRPIRADTPSELITIDEDYLDRVTHRRSIIATHGSTVHGCIPEGDAAVRELYTYLLSEQLPKRFPTIFKLSKDNSMCENLATGMSFPTLPEGNMDAALRVLGETVEEDLFLLQETPEGHRSVAFMCCFPAGFDPSSKLGKTLVEIHAPVPSYEKIGSSMEKFFTKLEVGKSVKRTNWSVQTHTELFNCQGNHITGDDKYETDEDVDIEKTFLRIELQTLTRLPKTRAILFSFKTYLYPVRQIKDEGLGPAFADAIEGLAKGNAPGMWTYKSAVDDFDVTLTAGM
ncbi:hypothetical protein FANTH_3461 [Fusarium anthophilum]|uniref:Glycosyltransferase family 31 protein n=1 Tax=Fusarium anthophilum TaxID=48485 RepID=A0A8H4ZRN6_9HYPO|nr:hypothetical protein FANTH_3461 [Fusarium anthophilum]